MQGPIQSWCELTAEKSPVEGIHSPDAETRRNSATELVYDLRQPNGSPIGSSDRFYTDAAAFSDLVLDQIGLRAQAGIRAYSHFVHNQLGEAPRTLDEYCIEFLTLGMVLSQYAGAAQNTPGWVVKLSRKLFRLRRKSPWIKPPADLLRSTLTRVFLLPRVARKATAGQTPPDSLPRLIEWLQATGEYEQETLRLNNWSRFLSSLPHFEAQYWSLTARSLFNWFQHEAEKALGSYTRGVTAFLAGPYSHRGCREDQIFCGRRPAEYHLGMVAAEVMNRGLREEFERKPHRVVLIPTCMRGAKARGCQARTSEMGLVCTACDPACNVNRMTRSMRSLEAKVFLIPHSTGFSCWLERWQRTPDHAVVAAACMLNILPGGFEMRARGIASQCVPLDYPGCKKHWSSKGIPTNLNQDRLVQLVQIRQKPTRSSVAAV